MDIASVPIIMVIVFSIVEAGKKSIFSKLDKSYMALIAGGIGGVLGIVAYYAAPELLDAGNVLYAFMAGFCSGLTGIGADGILNKIKAQKAQKQQITIELTEAIVPQENVGEAVEGTEVNESDEVVVAPIVQTIAVTTEPIE